MSCKIPRVVYYYSDKINIYDNNAFIPLPTTPAPIAPSPFLPIFQPIANCNTPYPTPSYYPPNPNIKNTCTCKK